MAYEDLRTYTEQDPNNHINDIGDDGLGITFVSVMNETAWRYRDLGVGHLVDFVHEFEIKLTVAGSAVFVYAFANTIDDARQWQLDSAESVQVLWWGTRLYLRKTNGGFAQNSVALALNTDYYCRLTRSGATVTNQIYSDSGRTVLVATRAVSIPAAHNYRYVFPAVSYNTGVTDTATAIIRNLDLGEVSTGAIPAPLLLGRGGF